MFWFVNFFLFDFFRYLQLKDAGIYECQVSTEPKMSFFINLNVVGKNTELNVVGKNSEPQWCRKKH
jgi:hypothetical protein